MIKCISVNNYKMFKEFRVSFGEGVNLICGPNGSGKSALCEIMHSLCNFTAMPDVSGRIAHSLAESFPQSTLCRFSASDIGREDMTISVCLGSGDSEYEYKLTARYNLRDGKARVQNEVLNRAQESVPIYTFDEGKITMQTDDKRELVFNGDWSVSGLPMASRNNSRIREFGRLMDSIYTVHLDPKLLAQDFTAASGTIGLNGEHFSAWHFNNTLNQIEKQSTVMEQCKGFIPGFVAFNSPKSGDVFRYTARVNHKGQNYNLEFRELSDGQKMLFALYSLLANVPDGATVIIDEPENYLAPGELQPWLDAVSDASDERGIQFMLITHNPKTLNWYHKEAIIFKVAGEPPRIVAEININEMPLFEFLREMEWESNG